MAFSFSAEMQRAITSRLLDRSGPWWQPDTGHTTVQIDGGRRLNIFWGDDGRSRVTTAHAAACDDDSQMIPLGGTYSTELQPGTAVWYYVG